MREKIKIRVFNLNEKAQRDLEFEMLDEHTKKESLAAKAGSVRQTRGDGQQRILVFAKRDFMFVSLSTAVIERSMDIC